MSSNPSPKLIATLKHIVELLVTGRYDELESLSHGVRLKAEHIRSSLDEYGGTLVPPPPSAFDEVDVIEIEGQPTPEYSIRFRLYTSEEGESDLEFQATFIDKDPSANLMDVEFDDILVA